MDIKTAHKKSSSEHGNNMVRKEYEFKSKAVNNTSNIASGSVKKSTSLNIKKLPVNFVRFTGRTIKNDVKNFAEHQVFKKAKLDTEYDVEIGANTIKSMYNAPIEAKDTIKSLKKGIEYAKNTIKSIPGNYRAVKRAVKDTYKITGNIYKHIKDSDLKGAFKQIPARRLLHIAKVGTVKATYKSGCLTKRLTIQGTNKFGKNFKGALVNKEDTTLDIGANSALFTTTLLKEGTRVSTRAGIKAYKGIKTLTNKRKLTKTVSNGIKTKSKSVNITNNVTEYFNKFKTSAVAKKEIKEAIKKLSNKFKIVVETITKTIVKNPIVLGIGAAAIIIIMLLMTLFNIVGGVHGSYFIDMDPYQPKWITNMKQLEKNTRSYSKTVRYSGRKADWRDVIIAYYIKNNNSASLSGASTNLGGTAESVDAETWDKIYAELQLYLGTPYQWGGSDPSTGFDCSGLVQYCYGKYGVELPRTTYEQVKMGKFVEESDIKAGDLVFFGTEEDVHHVGVYIGNGQYLHSPQTGDVIKISEMNSRSDFYEARRVFEEKSIDKPSDDKPSDDTTSKDKILYQCLPNHKEFVDIFYRVSDETGVDAILLASIAMTESSMNPNCVSSAGASGLCQLMPDTFTFLGFNIADIFDPYINILACAYEIKDLYRYPCINSVEDMLTAYNGGIGNFIEYNGPIPGNKENMEYASKVLNYYSQFSDGKQPSAMEGELMGGSNGVNTTLSKVYNAFVKVYRRTKNNKHYYELHLFSVEEALKNLKFTEDEKEYFEILKEYNKDFDNKGQFKDYNIDFKFDV